MTDLSRLSGRKLAKVAGISPTTAARVKRGQGTFDSETMKAIYAATGVCLCCGRDPHPELEDDDSIDTDAEQGVAGHGSETMTEDEIVKAYLRGADWAWQNGDDRAFVAKAAWDYADKQGSALAAAPPAPVGGEPVAWRYRYVGPSLQAPGPWRVREEPPVDEELQPAFYEFVPLYAHPPATSPEREEAKRLVVEMDRFGWWPGSSDVAEKVDAFVRRIAGDA
jgi:transcriptional regulator with XRE-family HTH domain